MCRVILHATIYRTVLHNKELPIPKYQCAKIAKLCTVMTMMKAMGWEVGGKPRAGDIGTYIITAISNFHYHNKPVTLVLSSPIFIFHMKKALCMYVHT